MSIVETIVFADRTLKGNGWTAYKRNNYNTAVFHLCWQKIMQDMTWQELRNIFEYKSDFRRELEHQVKSRAEFYLEDPDSIEINRPGKMLPQIWIRKD